jgi:hypothetical protein
MSWSQGFPNSFSPTQQTQEVLKNTDNETKRIYQIMSEVFAADGHAHTGDGSDGAPIDYTNITNAPDYGDYTLSPKFADIITKYPVIDARAYGVTCDGVTDDTVKLQELLDLVGGTLADYQAGIYKGGKILIPGICRITAPIYIGQNTKIVGLGSVSFRSSFSNPQPSGSIILCDFTNTEQYAVNVVGWTVATGNRISSYFVSGSAFDAGTVTFCDNVELENISIYTTQDIAIGLRIIGSKIKLQNVGSVGFRNGVVLSSCYGGSADNIFVRAKHSGFSPLDSCNGFKLSNSYISKIGNLTMDASNKIIDRCDSLDGTLYARTGIYSCYSQSIIFDNVITELWDRYYRITRNDALKIQCAYMEGTAATDCFDITQSTFNIDSFWVLCNTSTTNVLRDTGASVGKISNIAKVNTGGTQYATFATTAGFSSIDATACSIPETQKPATGIKMFTHTDFYVDSSIGLDTNSGTQNSPFLTISKAISSAVDGSTVYLNSGQSFNVASIIVPANRRINITKYGSGANPIIVGTFPGNQMTGFRLNHNCSLYFSSVEIQIPTFTASDTSYRSIIKAEGSNISLEFKSCSIKIAASTALVQTNYSGLGSVVINYLSSTIDGISSSYGYLGLPVFSSTGRLTVKDFSYGSTINATIKTNGYAGAYVEHSDILT